MKILRDEFGVDRVKIHPQIIEGELNVVALQEIVASMPDETDRQKGEEILRMLGADWSEVDEEKLPDYDTDELEPDLQSLLSQLITND
jgi:hypothetical protein